MTGSCKCSTLLSTSTSASHGERGNERDGSSKGGRADYLERAPKMDVVEELTGFVLEGAYVADVGRSRCR